VVLYVHARELDGTFGAPASERGVLSSADQCNIADTAWQYCLGSAPDSTPRSLVFAFK